MSTARPTPAALLIEAKAMPCCIRLDDFIETILILQDKGFTPSQTARWLTEQIHVPVTRTQVYSALKRSEKASKRAKGGRS